MCVLHTIHMLYNTLHVVIRRKYKRFLIICFYILFSFSIKTIKNKVFFLFYLYWTLIFFMNFLCKKLGTYLPTYRYSLSNFIYSFVLSYYNYYCQIKKKITIKYYNLWKLYFILFIKIHFISVFGLMIFVDINLYFYVRFTLVLHVF